VLKTAAAANAKPLANPLARLPAASQINSAKTKRKANKAVAFGLNRKNPKNIKNVSCR